MTPHARPIAFLVCAVGIGSYSGMDAFMKGLTLRLGVYDAMLWRALIGFAMAGTMWLARGVSRPSAAVLRMHATRGVVMTVMALLFFWGLARVPMAQAVALTFVAPLLSLFLSALLLKERIGVATVAGSLAALAGVGVILAGQASAPAGPEVMPGVAAILASALLYAFNIVLMRRQALSAGPIDIAFYQYGMMSACLALAAPFAADVPAAGELPALAAAAVLALAAALLMAWAYARAEASYLAMTEYTAFIWAALLGWLMFGEGVTMATLAGAALIVGGCLAAIWRRPLPPLANAEAAA